MIKLLVLVSALFFTFSCGSSGYGTYQNTPITPTFHEIQPGQSLAKVANIYGVTPSQIALLNGIRDLNSVQSGQIILVKYSASETDGLSHDAGHSHVPSEKLDRKPIVSTGTIASAGSSTRYGTTNPRINSSVLKWPVGEGSGRLTSGFGKRWGRAHKGIDIAAKTGTTIRSAHSGEVFYSGNKLRGFGNLVIVKGDDGYTTLYAHNKRLNVRKGEKVVTGQKIAELGSTGRSTGPHLHFEVRKSKTNGEIVAIDPMPYLESQSAASSRYQKIYASKDDSFKKIPKADSGTDYVKASSKYEELPRFR